MAWAPSFESLLDQSKENCVIGPLKVMVMVPSFVVPLALAVPNTAVLRPVPVMVLYPATALVTESGPMVAPPTAIA